MISAFLFPLSLSLERERRTTTGRQKQKQCEREEKNTVGQASYLLHRFTQLDDFLLSLSTSFARTNISFCSCIFFRRVFSSTICILATTSLPDPLPPELPTICPRPSFALSFLFFSISGVSLSTFTCFTYSCSNLDFSSFSFLIARFILLS
eukprot:TRINITY_DN4105_c0_g1_i1.p1 TRINITY_DN4105_c0_g1~~TRINITY_DN4105_c0_g1_i1.p1  ORF type:complete len:151 (-),score=33.79 TRINITY_DN4105_c0_g1_i1:5-457(-)